MNLNLIVEDFKNRPYLLNMGSGKLCKAYSRKLREVITREDIYKAKELARTDYVNPNFPKILVFDIETSPSISYTFARPYSMAVSPLEYSSHTFSSMRAFLIWSVL